MKSTPLFLLFCAAMTAALPAPADVLELKNGKVLTGSYAGGTAATIRFQTAEGLQVIESSQALAPTFTGGGALVPIMTGPYAQAGANSMGKTAKGAAAGAAIGAISGNAGKGAAYGAAASGLKKGESVVVSPGTLIEFQLQQPVTVNIAR